MPHDTREAASGGEGFVLVPLRLTDEMRTALHHCVRIRCDIEQRTASILNAQEWWEAVVTASPAPPIQGGVSSPLGEGEGELERLSAAASAGFWGVETSFDNNALWVGLLQPSGKVGQIIYAEPDLGSYRGEHIARIRADAAFIVALVNDYRAGHLAPASRAALASTDHPASSEEASDAR